MIKDLTKWLVLKKRDKIDINLFKFIHTSKCNNLKDIWLYKSPQNYDLDFEIIIIHGPYLIFSNFECRPILLLKSWLISYIIQKGYILPFFKLSEITSFCFIFLRSGAFEIPLVLIRSLNYICKVRIHT